MIGFQFKMEDMYQKKEQGKLPKTISISNIGKFKYDDRGGYQARIKGIDVSLSCEDKTEYKYTAEEIIETMKEMEYDGMNG